MFADMSGRSAAEMDDSQELPVSLRTVMQTQCRGLFVCITVLPNGCNLILYIVYIVSGSASLTNNDP